MPFYNKSIEPVRIAREDIDGTEFSVTQLTEGLPCSVTTPVPEISQKVRIKSIVATIATEVAPALGIIRVRIVNGDETIWQELLSLPAIAGASSGIVVTQIEIIGSSGVSLTAMIDYYNGSPLVIAAISITGDIVYA